MLIPTETVQETYKQDMINFGLWVEKRREELNLSLDTLAEKSGIDSSYIRRIEKGDRTNPSFLTVYALTNLLGGNITDVIPSH